MTISGALDAAAARYPERPLILADDGDHSYADVNAAADRLAAGLVALGVQPGDHVAMVMANYPEFVMVKMAIARAGATCVPINYLFRQNELGYVLEQSDARVLITMDRFRDLDYLGALDNLAPGWETEGGGQRIPRLREVVVFAPDREVPAGARSLGDLAALGGPGELAEVRRRARAADPAAPADVIYTSGTTGMPKGVLLTHDMLLRTAYASAYTRAFQDGRRIMFALPLYHVFGYVEATLAVLFAGGAVLPQLQFDAAESLASIERHRIDEVMFVPTMTLAVLDEAKCSARDLSSLSVCFSSGGQSPVRIWQDILDTLGVEELFTAYGQTETTASTTCVHPGDPLELLATTHGRYKPAGVAGDPTLGGCLAEYKTVDPATLEAQPFGVQGELWARGPIITPGYYNKPEETAAALTADGWLRTGDLGRVEADGTVTLTGRLKETFRCGGEQVMPKEIEDLLTTHPAVELAHLVGVPDERMGEIGCACVILRDGEMVSAGELIGYCAENLARFKVPRHVLFIDAKEVPVSATGKVQKFALVQWAVARLAEQEAS